MAWVLQKENFPPSVDLESPVLVDHQYQLKSPGHIAKLQLARVAAAQHAHRWSAAPATSSESKAVQALSRRRAAAEWVEVLTGIALPTAADAALRGALRDGMLLCKILNILRPGILPKVPLSVSCQPVWLHFAVGISSPSLSWSLCQVPLRKRLTYGAGVGAAQGAQCNQRGDLHQ